MILGRLFGHLFRRGVTVVATSNVEPDRLYEGGLNRALFLPFVATLTDRVDVVRLDSRTDFRLEKLGGAAVYHVPADAAARAACQPIDDKRGTKEYRIKVAGVLARRTALIALERARKA